ncbi:non-ribosomal peptide synthetase [Vitiosangium sp. GDMCC 1.1324]|uniref:amino acid adenylation domain-containing protein n=1 Tax=Vitiosangium sp. (strain GDMCC 1.1324) TaxID=2138576 RepID=UPI000D39EF34|nr:non-ribosomal peptide synthetase [Vitiosangium sp. GDMCC 1.1324]PTL79254.1 non-ribosomal peptide synthetase [Vitiosangium sp. GDMCC 1.1324]
MASRNDLDTLSPGEKRALLKQLLERGAPPAARPNVPVSHEGPTRRPAQEAAVPSFAQERMWFLHQLAPGSAAYNVPRAVELGGSVDAGVLEAALRQLLSRHAALRSVFPSTEGRPLLSFREPPARVLATEDLSSAAEAEREGLLARRLREEATRPFDLEQGPLYRFHLFRLSPQRHVFLYGVHHLVIDGWSANVLMRELGALYTALGQQQAPQLAPLPLEYADFASWQRTPAAASRETEHLEYWKRQLAEAPSLLELPTDNPRPAVRSDTGAQTEPLPLPATLTGAVRALCRERQVTPFMVFYAAFAALLHRYSQQAELCVGTPVAGRTHLSMEGVVGLFVNTVVLRSHVSPGAPFASLLSQVRETTLGAYAHQEAPFERVVEALQVERSLSWTPLFQVMFDLYQEERSLTDALGGPGARAVHVDTGTSHFDLSLTVVEGASGFSLSFQYSTELFEAGTVQRMLGHYVRMLEHAVTVPQTPVDELPLLSPAEREQVLVAFNDTARPFDAEATIVSLFEAQAARTPDAPAVVAPEGTLTFRALAEQASRLSSHLVAAGAGPEAVVGLCLERSLDAVVSLLAIFMSGAGCLPLESSHPVARRAALVRKAGARLVVSRPALFAGEPLDVPLVSPDVRAQAAPTVPHRPARAEHLAYLLYTSGSTGEPKGVELTHRNVVHCFAAFDPYYETRPGDRWASSGSLSFDIHLEELLFSITRGACTFLRDVGPLGLGRDILRHGITHVVIMPSSLATALEEPGALEAFRSLKVLVTGGEVLPDPLVRQLALTRTRLVNTYGPTETSINVAAERSVPERPVRLGRPLDRCRLYVLDERGEPVPPGVPGELYIGGTCLGRGYRSRPELTADRFVPDAFSGVPGERLYRTGDRVRWNADGSLGFLGRTDFQVKVRGVRVELEEIEATLLRQPGVRQAAVVVRGSGRDTRLDAFFVPDSAAPANGKRLREALRLTLPEAMVPSRFVALQAVPFTTSGKVDRKALAALSVEEASVESSEGEPPRGPVEELLAQLFCQVLGREKVWREENFFHLGGHSLSATRLLARARQAFGVELPLSAIFATPHVAGLAQAITGLRGSAQAEVPAPTPRPAGASPVLSAAQERMWLLHQLRPDSSAYHMSEAVELEGALDARALDEALRLLLTRHPVLRTTISVRDGQPVAHVRPVPEHVLRVESLEGLSESETQARLAARLRQEADRPYDLEEGPLHRFWLWRLGSERHVLLLAVHHLLVDGIALDLVVGELGEAYAPLSQGQQPALAPVRLDYADVAAWQRTDAVRAREDAQLGYWRKQLDGVPGLLQLPTDRPRPAVLSDKGSATPRLRLTPELVQALGALCRQHQLTPFMALCAAFSALLYRHSGQEDFCVGTPVSGRTHPATENVVGLFVNTVVLRTRVEPSASFASLLSQVRATALEAFTHQDVSFDRLVSHLGVERGPSHSPLFQVAFAWHRTHHALSSAFHGLASRPVPLPASATKAELALAVHESDSGLELELEYSTELFEAASMRRLLEHYLQLLTHALRSPHARVDSLSLLSGDERHFVLRACNDSLQPVPEQDTVVSLLSAHARRAPEQVALAFEGGRWTYAELEAHTNRAARALVAQGVGPESLVALVGPRTEATVRAVLSVHKAGGAFLPLESRLPPARIAQVLSESRPPFALALGDAGSLLTQALELLPPELRPRLLSLEHLDAHGPEPLPARSTPDSLAYVLFTSGSTGVPKGVMIDQRGMLNHILGMQRSLGLGSNEVITQTAALSFDISVWQMLGAFALGGTTWLLDDDVVREPLRLASALEASGATTVQLVPSVLQALLEDGEPHSLPSFARLRRMVTIGEALPPAVCRAWFSRYPQVPLANTYGPAECSDTATVHVMDAPPSRASTPIGMPKANMEVYVLDEALQPVPTGVVGELYIGGVGVGRGYRHRPELTAERFLPHPFSQRPGARLYRTGDLGRRLPDGRLEFLSRTDFQVKVRGMRIELAEIESALLQLPPVRSTVVLARERRPGDKYLVAFVVPADSGTSEASVKESLAGLLPGYMVPARIVLLEALPLSPNGKVDRKALAALPVEESARAPEGEAPRGPVEERLAGLFRQVLGLEDVRREDDFFQLGGHSLTATRLMARVRQSFDVELPLSALFAHPTVARLALEVSRFQGGASGLPAPTPLPAGTPPVLSTAQESLWFEQQLQPRSSAYHTPEAVELKGSLDTGALEEALRWLLARHSVLREVLPTLDGNPVAAVQPVPARALSHESLAGVPEARERLTQRLREEVERPFDLERGPLYRFWLWRLGPEHHVLLVVFHHVLVDGLSLDILLRELGQAYAFLRQGQPPALPPVRLAYTDVAAWQRTDAVLAREASQLEYWKRQLSGAPGLLQLPTDKPRPAAPSQQGGFTGLHTLSPEQTQALQALCQQHQVTPFMVLYAAFAALLHRYSGQGELCVGAPSGGRTHPALEDVVGLLVSTLVLRTRVEPSASFASLLGHVRTTLLEALAHQDVPFERIVRSLSIERSASHSPLFQVMFDFVSGENTLADVFPGLEGQSVLKVSSGSPFDLSLSVFERGGTHELGIRYSADLFEPGTVRRMLGHYLQLLTYALRSPHARVDSLSLLSEDERHFVLRACNDSLQPVPEQDTVVSLLSAHARRAPEQVALAFEGGRWTYAELEAHTNRAARALVAQGVGPESLVVLVGPRTEATVRAVLSVHKAGGAFLPLESRLPPARIAQVLSESRPPFALALGDAGSLLTQALALLPPELRPRLLSLEHLDAHGPEPLPSRSTPDSLAYVLFTSGSTGVPKGVMIDQRGMLNHILGMQRSLGLGSNEVITQTAALSFDISVWQMLGAFALGGTTWLLDDDVVREPLRLASALEASGATTVQLVPSVLQALLEDGESHSLPSFARLRRMVTIGEALPPAVCRAWFARYPQVPLANTYGPAECSDTATVHVMDAPPSRASTPIGMPKANMEVYVLDESLQPVPTGVVGELYIGGVGVGRGYRHRPELTAERFLPHPFSQRPGARLYRTGDLGRRLPDGRLEFLSRTDFQVKVRGMRIELAEIESALLQLPTVRSTVVLARERRPGDKYLVAFVVPADSGTSEASVKESLAGLLPGYMVPARIVLLEALPLSPNGKVDRKALAALPVEESARAPEGEAPRGPVEERLAGLFQQVLGLEDVRREDDFFQLGGHSLTATRLMARVRQSFDVELPVNAVFSAPTVAGLAARIGNAPRRREEWPPAGPRPSRVPASLVQERLWYALQLPEAPPYSLVQALVLDGALDVAKLERALAAVVERNETLRSTFFQEEETLLVQVGAPAGVGLARTDLSHLSPERAMEEARAAVTRHDARPFDARLGPLYRFELLRLDTAGTRHVLIAAVSHLVIDGMGMQALMNEVAMAYRAALADQPVLLPLAPVQYADFALWQRRPEHARQLDESLQSWKQALADAPTVLDLPLDFPRRAPALNANMRQVPISLGTGDAAALKALARREGVSTFTAVLALMQAWLLRLSNQPHVVVGSPFSGRTLPETERLVGYFTNVLPLCTDVSSDPSFRTLLKRAHAVVTHATAHQELPFKRIADAVQPDADRTAPALAQALLLFEPFDPPGFEGLEATALEADGVLPAYDVVLSLVERAGGGLGGVVATDSALFTATTMGRMADAFQQLAAEAVRAPDLPLSRVPLLSAEQRARVLAELDGGPRAVPPGACVHTLFEAQVRRTPEAPAVAHGTTTWSYAELNARANLLAVQLLSQGLRPEERVGVMMEPSAQGMAVLLGILKAGGAYVPLDPGWPEQRKRAVLARAGVRRLWLDAEAMETHYDLAPMTEVPPRPEHVAEDLGPGPRTVSDSQLAYIVFTSGSTGEPKGVMVEHRSVVNHNLAIAERFGLRPGDRMLQFAPLSFDAAAEDLYPPLAVGATVVMRSGLLPAHAMTPYLEQEDITIISLPPTYIEEWVRQMEAQGQRVPERLRLLAPGGDVLKRETFEAWQGVGGTHAPWVNVYGPTECTITSATCDIPGAEGVGTAPTFPIGRPITRVRFYLLDEHFEPVPPGLPGRVYIGGAALSRGYLEAPHLTAERFLPDPFSREPGARMYHTGDLARLLPDGRLRFLGRADHQVKIRGFRIELSEIETCLRRYPQVEEAVVLARTSSTGMQQLCAYVQAPAPVKADALRTHVAEQLPSYMVPAAFVVLEKLPVNNNGKVDRHALPDPEALAAAAAAPVPEQTEAKLETPFRSTLEMRLQRLWSEVLNQPGLGAEDDFFLSGGDSILAMRLLGRMEEEFGLPVPLATLFQAPVLKDTADALRELMEAGPSQSSVVRLSGQDTPADAPPIFFLHPGDGELHHYRHLAPRLEPHYRSFGIQAPETLSQRTFANFDERLSTYVKDIQAVQPRGPYRLVGYSYGGYLAIGVAAALEALGEKVELMAMLDTITLQVFKEIEPTRADPALQVAEEFGVLDEELERELAPLQLDAKWERVAARAKAKGTAANHFDGRELARLWRILGEILVPQVREWNVPASLRARLLLFRAEGTRADDETLGWGHHVPREQIDVVQLPGSHFSPLQPPDVDSLARRLRAILEQTPR